MIKEIQKYSVQFIVLVMAQLLIFNNIEFSGFVNPYVYVLFILLLPFGFPGILLLIFAFATGFIMDIFSGTPGVHSTATVLMAFLRPAVARIVAPGEGYLAGPDPRILYYGLAWFVKYTALLVIVHHFTLFYLEMLSMDNFFATFLRALASAAFSIIIIILSQFLIFRK